MKSPLSTGWQFSQVASSPHFDTVKEAWLDCEVPTSVHVELRNRGRIPDPFKGLAEWDVQWIQEADWDFRTTFEVSAEQLNEGSADLVFEGLDTYCDIYLNDKHLASTENMFMPHRVPAKANLMEGKNTLLLHFKSPWYEAKKAERENGGPKPLWNGASNRLYSRKAQYGWGWDWGPIMMTVGPWKPVRLETYTYRFDDVRVDTDLHGPDFDTASLSAAVAYVGASLPAKSSIKATLKDARGQSIKEETIQCDKKLHWNFEKGTVEGWYPIHYGSQPLYQLDLALLSPDGKELATSSTRVAFRHVRLVQDPLEGREGSSFLFEVNGIRVFCGGSNWIPADSFLTEIKVERYERWIDLMVEGNQNMLRVWGGGIYEDEALYNACDQRGILVWQDFMFGCGLYPSYPSLNDNIKAEAESVVRRLRDHPSVVIFAGNNEDYTLAEGEGKMDYKDNSGDYMNGPFPARHIYENILPEVVGRLSTIAYHRGSPYGGKKSQDPTVGDIHQWNVWHGSQEPWSNWDKLAGRFVSEFGMQGYPDMRTVKQWDDDPKQLFPQSRVSVNHNKATGFERRLELYLMENMRHAFDMPSYIYYTQIMQAECLSAAYRLWRREWRGKGKEYVAGALVWQLNDCWPCVSWAIADYYLRPKPAFYAVARGLRPFTVGMTRRDIKTPKSAESEAFYEIDTKIELWACNSTLKSKDVLVQVTGMDLLSGKITGEWTSTATLGPNCSTELHDATPFSLSAFGQPVRTSTSQTPRPIILHARLFETSSKEVLARYTHWPEPLKYLTFPPVSDLNLKITVNGDEVRLKADRPIKGIVLDTKNTDADAAEVKWSDQAIDLFPGDPQMVFANGLKGREVVARYIGDGSA